MSNNYIILFDQNTLHYRQALYQYFKKKLVDHGYTLLVVYDLKLTKIDGENDFFIGINYSFKSFKKIIQKYNCIEDTIDRARHFANIAKDSLGTFEETQFKEILINLVTSGLTRSS